MRIVLRGAGPAISIAKAKGAVHGTCPKRGRRVPERPVAPSGGRRATTASVSLVEDGAAVKRVPSEGSGGSDVAEGAVAEGSAVGHRRHVRQVAAVGWKVSRTLMTVTRPRGTPAVRIHSVHTPLTPLGRHRHCHCHYVQITIFIFLHRTHFFKFILFIFHYL